MVQRGKGVMASSRTSPMASTWLASMSPEELEGQVKIRRRHPADSRQLGFQVGDGGE